MSWEVRLPTAPLRPCLHPGCPALVRDGSRCPSHRLPEPYRGTRQQRGYTADWYSIVGEAVRQQPWCSVCGHEGSPDNPLTGDHILALEKGGMSTGDNCQVLCRHCNSRKRHG